MRIDFHTHPVLIQEMVDKYPNYARMAREVFQIGNNFQPLETFHLQMDVAGIDRAVLLPIDCEKARGDAVSSNEQVAELCTTSDRFIGFASVDPLKTGAAKELEHAVKKMGMKGLKLDPALQDFELRDSKVYELYETATGLNIPVLVHTGMSWAPATLIETATWTILLSVVLHGLSAAPLSARYGRSVATAGALPEKASAAEPRIRPHDLAGRHHPGHRPAV